MYSIYVTNKCEYDVLIRLQPGKLSDVNPTFTTDLDWLDEDKTRGNKNSYLLRWGFCLILPQQTMSFAFHPANEQSRKFASLCASEQLWTMDFEMDCFRYGCLFIKCMPLPSGKNAFFLIQVNPKPVWIRAMKGDPALPTNYIIKAGSQAYLGRDSEGTPCQVAVNGSQLFTWGGHEYSGELLRDTGHEFIRAKAGDFVPPHAITTGVSEPEGSLFLGMVGGQHPCSISVEEGKIKSFCWGSQKVHNSEVLVLTNDPS